jgi:DNA polymerase I-like protein with 3'-5' exonuclease and polymerase domains
MLFRPPPGRVVAVDCETTGLDAYQGHKPFAFSFCDENGITAYVEWDVDPRTREVQISPRDLRVLRRFFADKTITKVFHNASFDLDMIEIGLGIPVRGKSNHRGRSR